MKATITKVYPQARIVPAKPGSKYGDGAVVTVEFLDKSRGEYFTKPDKADGHIALLTKLLGIEEEFTVEQGEYQGEKFWKIKDYPGKPVSKAGGPVGGREWKEKWSDTQEGFAAQTAAIDARHAREQDEMNKRTALMQAVAASGTGVKCEAIVTTAKAFYECLKQMGNG